ncbi:hypothetical protein OG21DRAFT_1471079 [Imleria badia]|nr:hypothetical protein OG21DRAFT_1471079 [Imleria badia]
MAATTDQQISLTVAPRGSSSHLNRPARQLVPAFLQKLYEMVNDPADQDLIRWSDTGDSFFVLDQERFASEVLGRWFKHKNFSTFVRQLNMYGFHKIPHLQQGVLRGDSDIEFSNFEHPHFLRGQPDLLCLIQRKKQPVTTGDDAHAAPAAGKDAAGNVAVGALSANQLVDINSIVNGIQAIKRHQAAISADLNELKSSNQHLWQEAMAARERHKKHQDTINRILKFLAGVFGADNQMRKDEDAPHAVVARKPQRLLIADVRSGQKADGSEGAEGESRSSMESARSTNSTDFFASLDTPSAPPSEPFTTPRFTSVEPSVTDVPTPVATHPRPPLQETPAPIAPPSNTTNATSLTAPTTTTPTPLNNDHIVQAALTSVLNSPTQMQKLLAALAAQSLSPELFASAAQLHPQQQLIAPSPYNDNAQQYTPAINPAPVNVHPNVTTSPRLPSTFDYAAANALSPFTLSLLGAPSDPDPFAMQQQDDRLQRTYKSTAEINNDVDDLQTNIQSLIQSLGIDPTTLDSVIPPPEAATGVGGGGGTSAPLPAGDVDLFPPVNITGQDFDFDSFLMDMPRANEEDGDFDKLAERLDASTVVVPKASDASKIGSASSEQLHAFLDEVASQDGSEGGGMGVPQLHGSQAFKVPSGATSGGPGVGVNVGAGVGVGPGTRGRKRKSDVIVDGAHTYAPQATQPAGSSITNNRSKRKR